MIIKISKYAGFCFGVERAINLALKAAKKFRKVYTLGDLIHNKREIERLKEFGIVPVNVSYQDINKVFKEGDIVIIRSHGVPPYVYELLKKVGVKIIDATCPFVKQVHKKIQILQKENYPTCIFGDPDHPEVIGIAGYAKEPIIIRNFSDLKKIEKKPKLGIVCQTTFKIDLFQSLISKLVLKVKDLKVFNTICSATYLRQEDAKKLASQVDIMFVIGGKNSSNTNKLYKVCKEVNKNTYLIESKEEIPCDILKDIESKNIGITAGASTPKWIIEEIVTFLKTFENLKSLKVSCG